MSQFSFELSIIAMLPGIFLCGYVFYKDRIEKEPFGLLALLFGAGAVIYIPSYFLEKLIVRLIDKIFANSMSLSVEGTVIYSSAQAEFFHILLCSVFGFALIPICLKFATLYFLTHRNKNFNYLFDGIVYSVFVSLGFALSENIVFAMQNDTDLIIAKAMTSVPCHLFIAIIMGYFYTMWHMRFKANKIENIMLKNGIVEEDKIRSSAGWLISGFIALVFIGSLYTLSAFGKSQMAVALFYSAVYVFYGLSFVIINHIADKDTNAKTYLCKVIAKGHPELSSQQIEDCVLAGEDD